MAEHPKAVVLVSGGLDSATVLAMARHQGYACHALSFDYGQRHGLELEAARCVARSLGAVQHRLVSLDIGWMGGSALTDPNIPVPLTPSAGIPLTYVPARNTIFLAIALGWAEVLEARAIFIGANAVDYSGYPDCRPAFIQAFEHLANLATRAGVEGRGFWHPCAPHFPDQGRDHPDRSAPGGGLFPDPVVLPSRCRRARLRAVRFLPSAGCGLCCRRGCGYDDLPARLTPSGFDGRH